MTRIKVLFLAANPSDLTHLQLGEEIRAIKEKVRASANRDVLDLESCWAVRPDDLLQSLNEHMPQIVHFSGHGAPSGSIILVDSNGAPKQVSTAALKSLFTTLKDNIRVVVLNACFSHIQAEAITEVIDCAIGMNTEVGDKAAVIFAASFYRAIGFGRSVQAAFEQGKAALLLENLTDESTPILLAREGIDPSSVVLVPVDKEVKAPSAAPKMQVGSRSLSGGASRNKNDQTAFLSPLREVLNPKDSTPAGYLVTPREFRVKYKQLCSDLRTADYIHIIPLSLFSVSK